MKIKPSLIVFPFLCGVVVTIAVSHLLWVWWPHFWIPFVGMTVLFYCICRGAREHPIIVGLSACLPCLLIPAQLWYLVLVSWAPVARARASGGLYTILTLGDPHKISTIALFLVLPITLVLVSGLSAGLLARWAAQRTGVGGPTTGRT
jgi:hypothetical protein